MLLLSLHNIIMFNSSIVSAGFDIQVLRSQMFTDAEGNTD